MVVLIKVLPPFYPIADQTILNPQKVNHFGRRLTFHHSL